MDSTIVSGAESHTNKRIALLLAVFTILFLLVTSPQIGLTWDEPTYIVAAETYPSWYRELIVHPSWALSADGVSQYWGISHEHPPLSKVWSGFIWLGARHFLDDLSAHRLGAILVAGGLVSLLFLMVTRDYGRNAGLVAAFALLTMPRFFFHAHLAAIDVPVTAMIFAVIFIFWLGQDTPGLKPTLLLGLAYGLALATKINALVIPTLVLPIWTLFFRRRRYLLVRLALTYLIGFCLFILSWPWLYHGLWRRLTGYVGFMTTDRLPVEQYYFGLTYAPPPWHFPFIMTILVVPFAILVLATIGAVSMMRNRADRPLAALLLLAVFFCLVIFSSGVGQVFDNERFMMPVFPYVAALAGVGFARTIPLVEKFVANRRLRLAGRPLIAMMSMLIFAPHLVLAGDLYPHLLSYYSELVGGVYGAKKLRLETTYWCETYSEVLPYLNARARPGAIINAECQDVLIYYQLHGLLRPDLQIANGPDAYPAFPGFQLNPATFEEADYVVIQNRQSGLYRGLRRWMQARRPSFEVRYRRLVLIDVYAR
jgi:4-amino-4-deoxy-L-arabinose transferase-like glycosyltransferase